MDKEAREAAAKIILAKEDYIPAIVEEFEDYLHSEIEEIGTDWPLEGPEVRVLILKKLRTFVGNELAY